MGGFFHGCFAGIASLCSCIFKRKVNNQSDPVQISSHQSGYTPNQQFREYQSSRIIERGEEVLPIINKNFATSSSSKWKSSGRQGNKQKLIKASISHLESRSGTSRTEEPLCFRDGAQKPWPLQNEKVSAFEKRKEKESKENQQPQLETSKTLYYYHSLEPKQPPRKKESIISPDFSQQARQALSEQRKSLQISSSNSFYSSGHRQSSVFLQDPKKPQSSLSSGIGQQSSQLLQKGKTPTVGLARSTVNKDVKEQKNKLNQEQEHLRNLPTSLLYPGEQSSKPYQPSAHSTEKFLVPGERSFRTDYVLPGRITNSSTFLQKKSIPEKFVLKETEISFYSIESWPEICSSLEGTDFKGNPLRKIEAYSLPKKYKPLFEKEFKKALLKTKTSLTSEESKSWEEIISKFDSKPDLEESGNTAVKESNYQNFFHDLLYIEEYEGMCHTSRYNMTKVPMYTYNDRFDEFELEVPGLAEKRPDILYNDIVYVRLHNEPTVEYSGLVVEVLSESIVIGGFHENLDAYFDDTTEEVLFDVRFTCCRLPYYYQHVAVDSVCSDIADILFPTNIIGARTINSWLASSIHFVNPDIASNSEQKQAIVNILGTSSGCAPYIIFGPPGTGKTATLVEAVLQVKLRQPNSHILVCSQNNGICDQIARKLYSSGKCSKDEILRLAARSKMRDIKGGISNITRSCPGSEIEGIRSYRIIVSTLMTAGRIVESNDYNKKRRLRLHTFSHLFIDEAGQASECQALIPISGLLKKPGGQLVLVGDPKQLGPVCLGTRAEKFGLGVSLLERLMNNFPIYQDKENGQYDNRYITLLVKNYRSHKDILEIPNQLFYNNKLKPQGIDDDLCYLSLNNSLKAGRGMPVLFHGVEGQEIIDDKSGSMWNKLEISMVVEYILKLINYETKDDYVKAEEIGVITPYFLQVQKIKQEFARLKSKTKYKRRDKYFNFNKVEVGTTESFQGREKRVIIVSTVRSQHNPNGFVTDPKRFNVIMTSAKAKLIVIGNPAVLKRDWRGWRLLLETVLKNKEYYGC